MTRRIVLLGGVAALLIAGAAVWVMEKRAAGGEAIAADMARFETEDRYVTTFTSTLLSSEAVAALQYDMGVTRLSAERRSAVNARFDEVALRSPHDNEPYVFLNILSAGKTGAVLFADSDYRVIITDPMVELCGRDPDMLRGLFAHELSHRELKHTRTRLIAAVSPASRLAMLSENPEPAADEYHRHPENLLGVRFPKAIEEAARDHADALLEELGFATGGFERCLEVLKENRDVPGVELFLQAHDPE